MNQIVITLDEIEKKIEEFKESAINHRHHNTLMLAQTTVFLAATGVLLNTIATQLIIEPYSSIIKVFGIILSLVFFIISERSADFSHASRNRATELQEELDFSLFNHKSLRKPQFMAAIDATRILYASFCLSWIFLLIYPYL